MSSPATPALAQQPGRATSSSSSSSGVCARVKMYSGRPFRRMEMGSALAAKSAPAVQMQPQLWINFRYGDGFALPVSHRPVFDPGPSGAGMEEAPPRLPLLTQVQTFHPSLLNWLILAA